MFAQHGDRSCNPVEHAFTSIFKACNLQGAISLLAELDQSPKGDATVLSPCFPGNLSECVCPCIFYMCPSLSKSQIVLVSVS